MSTVTPTLTTDEAMARLQQGVHEKSTNFAAMYSSVLGGIVTDPALMVLPLDDHMVHRGHAVFDTAAASGWRDGSVRYWLSAGQGGFGLALTECIGSSFYVMIFRGQTYPDTYYTEGLKVISSTVPIKPPFFARVKSGLDHSVGQVPNLACQPFGRRGTARRAFFRQPHAAKEKRHGTPCPYRWPMP